MKRSRWSGASRLAAQSHLGAFGDINELFTPSRLSNHRQNNLIQYMLVQHGNYASTHRCGLCRGGLAIAMMRHSRRAWPPPTQDRGTQSPPPLMALMRACPRERPRVALPHMPRMPLCHTCCMPCCVARSPKPHQPPASAGASPVVVEHARAAALLAERVARPPLPPRAEERVRLEPRGLVVAVESGQPRLT
eukprot:6724363-Prymnesium_polylepis.1